MDKLRNVDKRRELGVESILKVIEKNRFRWFDHISRMGHNRQVKEIREAKTKARLGRGRSR